MMNYPVLNLNPSLGQAPAQDCSSYQYRVDRAAENIAIARRNVQDAVAIDNSYAVSAANEQAAQANKDWQAAKEDLNRCMAPTQSTSPEVPSSSTALSIVALAVGVVLVGAVVTYPALQKI